MRKLAQEAGADDIDKDMGGFSNKQHLDLVATRYRDKDGNEYTQVTATCKCGRGGWLRIPKMVTDPDLSAGVTAESPTPVDLLETERERVYSEILDGLPDERSEIVNVDGEKFEDFKNRHLARFYVAEAKGWNDYRNHTLEVIERLRLASVRKANSSPDDKLNNGGTQRG